MPSDRNGQPVTVGTRVRILRFDSSLERQLPPDEWEQVAKMIGQVFEVYEVDEYGSAWVEKVWFPRDGERMSHSVALAPEEMEVV
jgi:hypothetical protein